MEEAEFVLFTATAQVPTRCDDGMERHAHFPVKGMADEGMANEEQELKEPSTSASSFQSRKRRSTRENFSKVFALAGGKYSQQIDRQLMPDTQHHKRHDHRPSLAVEAKGGTFGKVLDPRSRAIQQWNRVLLLSYAVGTAIDPLFLYMIGIDDRIKCMYIEGWFAIMVTCLRTGNNVMYLLHIWQQLKLAYLSQESMRLGRGALVFDPKLIVKHYLRPSGGFIFDLFVILPIPELGLWVIVPHMISKGGETVSVETFLLLTFLFQYIPKIVHLVKLMRRLQRVTGYIFGTPWWGFALNMIAYFISAHVAGAVWYLLTVQRVSVCMRGFCERTSGCNNKVLGCPRAMLYGPEPMDDPQRISWGTNTDLSDRCLGPKATFDFGIYVQAVPLVTERSRIERIMYPLFWGLMTLSTFGNNLVPGNHMLEVTYSLCIVICGLLLFMLLIGNIQVFLQAINTRKEAMQLRFRDLEWWMRRRQLPSRLRKRVIHFEREKWAAMRGVDEEEMICDLPESLRRDIKRHLCVDLVRQVPLFQQLDDLVIDNICERLKPLLLIKHETVIREGDPVQKMLFIVRGQLESTLVLYNHKFSSCKLGPGQFCGDELLSWCLRSTSSHRMPASNSTIVSLEGTEVFAFEADDLKYVTDHFRYMFESNKIKGMTRYYSASWRTWAAVTIQFHWRKSKLFSKMKKSVAKPHPPQPATKANKGTTTLPKKPTEPSISIERLKMISSMFRPKPHR